MIGTKLAFNSQNTDIRRIAEALGVTAILVSSATFAMRRAGDSE